MTPKELHDLVRELPREIWPDDLHFISSGKWFCDVDGPLSCRTAAALFTARLVEELGKRTAFVIHWDSVDGWFIDMWARVQAYSKKCAPTLLQALISAYKATGRDCRKGEE